MLKHLFLACFFEETSSPGNKIGGQHEYTENVESISKCQFKCQEYHNIDLANKSCDYFTYYNKTCILKTAKARWNLLFKPGSITGTRECDLDYSNGKIITLFT